jgi:histone family protein DNA-binding protein
MTEKDFLDVIKESSGVAGMTNAAAKRIYDALIAKITETLVKEQRVALNKLGVLTVINTKERKARNIATGEAINIPAGKKVKFSPASSLKHTVKES